MRALSTYNLFNLFISLVIGIVFSYSYFFYPNKQPIGCIIKKVTGKNCPACGLLRAFSAFTHGEWEIGKKYNALAFPAFLFFAFQVLGRMGLVLFSIIRKKEVSPLFFKLEVILTICQFLYCFFPFIYFI